MGKLARGGAVLARRGREPVETETVAVPSPEVAGFIVARDRLVGQVLDQCGTAGIVLICAPRGFGKTALLLQGVAAVRTDPARGIALMMSARAMDAGQLMARLDRFREELTPSMGPIIFIDDLPRYEDGEMERLGGSFRDLRHDGYAVVVATSPDNRAFVNGFGDSAKIGAQGLCVQPREFASWSRAYSIATTLDIHGLTRGVPLLVASLQGVVRGEGAERDMQSLDRQVEDLYREVLDEVALEDPRLHRFMALLTFLGEGSLKAVFRYGARVDEEAITRIRRDYPIIYIDGERQAFSCLGSGVGALKGLREELAREHPELALRAVRVLMRTRRVDRAVEAMEAHLARSESLTMIARFPVDMALAGQAMFVRDILAGVQVPDTQGVPIGALLALYLCALTMGDCRTARGVAVELRRHPEEIEREVQPGDWACALAMRRAWAGVGGADLPQLSAAFLKNGSGDTRARLLSLHERSYTALVGGPGRVELADDYGLEGLWRPREGQLDVGPLLLQLDVALDAAIRVGVLDVSEGDSALREVVRGLEERRLMGLAARVRMVAATRRLLAGLPVTDERGFGDAGTVAVREADLPTQLFCLAAEGWQALTVGQVVNGQFRAQQVLRLAAPEWTWLRSWALLLERTSTLLNSSRVTIREEAEVLDLANEPESPAGAWCTALWLSAAHLEAELSVWVSLQRPLLFDERFRPLARLAMSVLGEFADPMRRMVPADLQPRYRLGTEALDTAARGLDVACVPEVPALGQVSIDLFGGFRVGRNGHVITDGIWRRKKASILAARLVLGLGTFVNRRTITDEMWPQTDYARARQSLYSATSTLKAALRQHDDGPQYLITQGEGIALNGEFVSSDTARFDRLAREVLLKRNGVSSRQIIESCLKLEEIYVGDLFVPSAGDTAFFVRMRRSYETRYVDCLVRGVDAAVEEEDMASASWLAEALMKRAPTREDVLRRVMMVYGMCGRRREVAEIYGAHLYYLKHELRAEPEPKTREVYESVVGFEGRAFL